MPAACAVWQMHRNPFTPQGEAPTRPSGTPKPMLQEDIRPILARLDAWYAANLRPDKYLFNPPTSDARLDAFERKIGLKLPSAYRQMYKWHDGENDDRWGHIYGLPMLSLHEAGAQWAAWSDTLQYFKGNRYVVPAAGWPKDAVDPAYINPRWIPLTHDGSGNHIGLDFDPWPKGRVGQVILFGRDEDVKAILADSLGGFLDWIATLLEEGNFRVDPEPGKTVLRQFQLKSPAVDSFHDGARMILGAPKELR